MDKRAWTSVFETLGSILGIVYALMIASNTGREVLGFVLLFASAGLFAAWAIMDRRWAFLALQVVYAGTGIWGAVRWS